MNRTLYRIILAVVALALLAIPALADINEDSDWEFKGLAVSDDTIILEDADDEATINFTAQNILGVGEKDGDLAYLIFTQDDQEFEVELTYDKTKREWSGIATVGQGEEGEWELADCYYEDDDTPVACDEVSFTVEIEEQEEEEDAANAGDESEAVAGNGSLAPKQLRAALGEDGEVELTWQCGAEDSDFTVWYGCNAGNMVLLTGEDDDDTVTMDGNSCEIDADELDLDDLKGNGKHILFRVVNKYGKSNVVVVPITGDDNDDLELQERDRDRVRDCDLAEDCDGSGPPEWAKANGRNGK